MSQSSERIETQLKCILCSYCGEKMVGGLYEVKKAVPPGASDLGVTEEVVCWKCPKCGLESTDHLRYCESCGGLTLDVAEPFYCRDNIQPTDSDGAFGYLAYEGEYFFGDDEAEWSYHCFHCEKCARCKQKLEATELVKVLSQTESEKRRHMYYFYYHPQCFEQSEEESAARVRNDRLAKGLCTECARPLNFLDKISSRAKHSSC